VDCSGVSGAVYAAFLTIAAVGPYRAHDMHQVHHIVVLSFSAH
jgi:hypothetical protein